MISHGIGKGEVQCHSDTSRFWMELLNSTQLVSKNLSHFPEVKACRLRMAYSKLQNPKMNESKLNKINFQTTKASFLLDKQSRHYDSLRKKEKKELENFTIFNHNTRYNRGRNSFMETPELIRTIDVPEIKRIKNDRRNESPELQRNGSNKKSQQFSDYFKKVILSQRASNELTKFYSQGKGLDISDRARFQKIERMKLSMLNQKLEDKQKSFHCISSKLNHYKLPTLKKKALKKKKQEEKITMDSPLKKPVSSFACQPWESDSLFNDIQQH